MIGFENMLPDVMYVATKGNMEPSDWIGGEMLVRKGDNLMRVYGSRLEINRGNAGCLVEEFMYPDLTGVEYELHVEYYVKELARLDTHYKIKTEMMSKILSGKCKHLDPKTRVCALDRAFRCDKKIPDKETAGYKCGRRYK